MVQPLWAPIQTTNTSSQSTMLPATQSALYWSPYMNLANNPLTSVHANPFAKSLPTSNTSTPLQGSNTIASLPVNLESDTKHSVHEINSPSKTLAHVPEPKKPRNKIILLEKTSYFAQPGCKLVVILLFTLDKGRRDFGHCNTLNLGVYNFFSNIHQIQVLPSFFLAFLFFFLNSEELFCFI